MLRLDANIRQNSGRIVKIIRPEPELGRIWKNGRIVPEPEPEPDIRYIPNFDSESFECQFAF